MAQNATAIARFYRAHCGKFTQKQCDAIKRKLMSIKRPVSGVVPTSAPKAKAHIRPATERSEPSQARPTSRPTSAPKAKVTPPPKSTWVGEEPWTKDDAVINDVRQFSQMSGRDKKMKLLDLARTALRKKHPGLKDPNDVTKWLVTPGSRKFTGHSERFRDDLEYRQLMLDSGCVDRSGKLALWTKDDHGKDVFKDFEAIVAHERAQKGSQKGKGQGKGRVPPVPKSAPSASSSHSWGSSSWNWQGSSWWEQP